MNLLEFNPGLIFWTVVTFVVLLVVLWRMAWKPLLGMIEERERSVREALEGAERARKETEEMARKHREMLDEVRRQAEAITGRGRAEAERMRQETLDRARRESEALLADGRKQLEREYRAAVQDLRASVADLAIGAAERILEAEMDEKKQRRLVEEYLESLPETESRSPRSS